MGERRLDRAPTRPTSPRQSLDEIVEAAVTRSIEQLLQPYLVKLQAPEPLVYTVGQAADVLQVSTDTVGRLVKRGLLVRVPHLDGKLLIPKSAVEEFIGGDSPQHEGPEVALNPGPASRRKSRPPA